MVEKDYAVLPTQQAYKVDVDAAPIVAEGKTDEGESTMDIRSTVLTNDIIVTWTTGEPGDIVPWHSHSPEMYQILLTTEGECVWYYKDNEGETQSIEAGEDEIVYLPAGAENKMEVTGDGHHTHIGVLKRPRIPRIEHLLGETADLYDAREFPGAFVFDDMNDAVVRMDEDAVSK